MKTGHIIMSINELERSDAFLKRPLLAHEKLIEVHKLKISLTVVRKLMIQDGLWNPERKQRKRVYQLRERRPRELDVPLFHEIYQIITHYLSIEMLKYSS